MKPTSLAIEHGMNECGIWQQVADGSFASLGGVAPQKPQLAGVYLSRHWYLAKAEHGGSVVT